MEPFADYAAIFPGFPHRNFYLEHFSDEFAGYLAELFQRLPGIKHNFLAKPGAPPFYQILDRLIVDTTDKFLKLFKLSPSAKVTNYNLLNLNKRDESIIFKKSGLPIDELNMVVKELRLNFKVCMIKKLFPEAKVLVSIRTPGAQITSIKRLLKIGGLAELRRSLLLFKEYTSHMPRFQKYAKLLKDFNQKPIEERLMVWWLINYEVLIEDLNSSELPYQVVYHEDLCEDPFEEVNKIFEFCEILMTKSVKNYIRRSTDGVEGVTSKVNTRRHSKEYYKTQIDSVGQQLNNRICQLLSEVDPIRSEIARYHHTIKDL